MEFLTSLVSFASLASWTSHPLMSLMLQIDGLIYDLLSYAFNLFMLMCQLDFSSLFGIVSPIVDRLQAVILVLVVFKLAMSLIKWMIDPESMPKEGSKIVVNIFITAMFLIGYNFVFDVFNEVGMLIMGAPEGREFVVLKQVADISGGDEGLIMRFIFGNEAKVDDIGDYMAFETIKIFVHDIDDPDNSPTVSNTICDGDKCKFTDLNEVSIYLDKTVEYKWGISGIVGIYLIYSIVKMAIEIGVRMFKLIILQILAPLAIITILDGGIKSNTFQTFYKKYLSVYAEAFTRMIAMLIAVVFVCKFYINIDSFFNPISDSGATGVTKFLLTILVVVSAFKIAGSIPKFIDEALGTKMSGGEKKSGFGKFVGGLVGGALGLAGGIGAGVLSGAGVSGTLMNAASGAFKGVGAGSKGNNVAEFFKNTSENSKASRERALNIARMGGGGQYALHGLENRLGVTQRNQARAQRQSDDAKAFENAVNARFAGMKDIESTGYTHGSEIFNFKDKNGSNLKFGDNVDSFKSQAVENDDQVKALRDKYQSLVNSGSSSADIENARKEYEKRIKIVNEAAESAFYDAAFNDENFKNNASVKEADRVLESRVGSKSEYNMKNIGASADKKGQIKAARQHFAQEQAETNNKASMQRENRPTGYNGK